MAANTIRPADTPRRANVPREPASPPPANVPLADAPAVPEASAPAHPAAPEKPAKAPKAEKAPRPEKTPEPDAAPRPAGTWSIFSLLDRVTSVDGLFREGLPVRYLPHLLFVMLLTLLYIGNTHYGNRMNRSIQRLKQETEDLRADYTTLKSDYMEASKQSEVARKVAAIGLVESASPPFRINVPAGHLDAAELELLPVQTADSLAARVARDSIATRLADSLAGRRRYAPAGDDTDAGPEIIAPPQLLGDEATLLSPAVDARATVAVSPKPKKQVNRRTGKKPDSRKKVQKTAKKSKNKRPAAQVAKSKKK